MKYKHSAMFLTFMSFLALIASFFSFELGSRTTYIWTMNVFFILFLALIHAVFSAAESNGK